MYWEVVVNGLVLYVTRPKIPHQPLPGLSPTSCFPETHDFRCYFQNSHFSWFGFCPDSWISALRFGNWELTLYKIHIYTTM